MFSFHPEVWRVNRFFQAMSSVCYSEKYAFYNAVNRGKLLTIDDAKTILSDWSIHDKQSMKETVHWLLEEGRRSEFHQIQKQLRFLNDEKRQQLIDSVYEEDLKHKMNVARQYMNRLPSSSIAAMDYAFSILLCTQAERASMISGLESFNFKLEAAHKAQAAYKSWPEYAAAFLAGLQFTKGSDEAVQNFMRDKEVFITKLLSSDHSPFQQVKWNTKLLELKEREERV